MQNLYTLNRSILVVVFILCNIDVYGASSRFNARARLAEKFHEQKAAQDAIRQSIYKEDTKALETALRNKLADPNKIEEKEKAPLLRVIFGCDDVTKRREMVKILLKYRADPNIPTHLVPHGSKEWRANLGFYPLHAAVSCQDSEIVKMLLHNNARVNVLTEAMITQKDDPTKICATPLHFACDPGVPLDFAIVRMLVDAGAQINIRAHDTGNTPLYLAVCNSNLQAIAYLLKHGARCDSVNDQGLTPVHKAVLQEDICALWTLCRYTHMDHGMKNPDEKIHKKIMEIASLPDDELLRAVQHVHAKYFVVFEGYTPLHMVTRQFSVEMMRELLKLGANPDSEAFLGVRPLHLAVLMEGTPEIRRERVRLLLEAGANLDTWARVYIDSKIHHNTTPLLLALRLHFYDIVADMCSWYSQQQRTLTETHASYISCVMKRQDLSFEQQCALIQKLIGLGANVKYSDGLGNILHIAIVVKEDPRMIEYLVHLGVPIDQKNKFGCTPYDFALLKQYEEIVNVLKPFEAARLSKLCGQFVGYEQLVDEARKYNRRIGDITRLHEYAIFFCGVPGIEAVLHVLQQCGTKDALERYAARSKKGAVGTARGALFELAAAYQLMLERYGITAFRVYYEGLEFDIETPAFLIECKQVSWRHMDEKRSAALKSSLKRHNEVVKRLGKQYLFYSKHPIPADWQAWFTEQDIVTVVHKNLPSLSQNKIYEQYLMPLVDEQKELCQKTSSSYQ